MKSLSIVSSLKNLCKRSKEALVSFVFPSYCLHCEDEVEDRKLLCMVCSSQLELYEGEACCFSPFRAVAVSMEKIGPAISLVNGAKGPLAEEIAKSIAAFMAITLSRKDWVMPDCIVPSPRSLPFSMLLAESLSRFLEIPVLDALRPSSFFYEQKDFRWNHSYAVSDKIVLVVDTRLDPFEEGFQILEEAAIKEAFFLSFI